MVSDRFRAAWTGWHEVSTISTRCESCAFYGPELKLLSQQLSAAKQVQLEKEREECLVCTAC